MVQMDLPLSNYDKLVAYSKTEPAKLVFSITGVCGTLMLYAVLQERIMRVPYKTSDVDEGEKFTFSLFCVLMNRMITAVVAFICLLINGGSIAPVAPLFKYAGVSLSNVVATTCQYEALKYVSMPTQTLAKCAKMIPVMIWGTLIMGKTYGFKDYSVTGLVTLGCTLFLMAQDSSRRRKKAASNDTLFGVSLMLGYLGVDGFTSTFQDMLFKGYNMEIYNQILYVTLCSSAVSAVGLLSAGQLIPALDFIARHPNCMGDILILSASATMSQFFISYTIKTFGALIFATIMTTRQLFTILLSCLIFQNQLTVGQWSGTGLVFGALYYKTYTHHKDHKEKAKKAITRAGEEGAPLIDQGVKMDKIEKKSEADEEA